MGRMTSHIWNGKIKHVTFETTKQIWWFPYSPWYIYLHLDRCWIMLVIPAAWSNILDTVRRKFQHFVVWLLLTMAQALWKACKFWRQCLEHPENQSSRSISWGQKLSFKTAWKLWGNSLQVAPFMDGKFNNHQITCDKWSVLMSPASPKQAAGQSWELLIVQRVCNFKPI